MSNYPEILSRRYPNLIWKMIGNDYATLTMLDGTTKPTQAALDAYWPSVETELALENGTLVKERDFQASYRIQNQLIEIMKAVRDNNNTKINEMLNLWEVINDG